MLPENVKVYMTGDCFELARKYIKHGTKTGGIPVNKLIKYKNQLTDYLLSNPDLLELHSDFSEKVKYLIGLIDDALVIRDEAQKSMIGKLRIENTDSSVAFEIMKNKTYFDKLIRFGEIDIESLEGNVLHMGAYPTSVGLFRLYGGHIDVVDNDPRKIDNLAEKELIPEVNIHEKRVLDFTEENSDSFDTVALIKPGTMKPDVFSVYNNASDIGLMAGGLGLSRFHGRPPEKVINFMDKKSEKVLESGGDSAVIKKKPRRINAPTGNIFIDSKAAMEKP
jgi:hypothetical protein